MKLFHRHYELSDEVRSAQRDAKEVQDATADLIERAQALAAKVDATKQTNGFGEIIAALYKVGGPHQ